jgi:hypothetical protein
MGYSLVGSVNNATTLSYTDLNNGQGLISGFNYCYIITATFANGAESHPSEPICTPLMIPFIRVLKDTITACSRNTIVIDTTIYKFENADQSSTCIWSASPGVNLSSTDKPVFDVTPNATGLYYIKIQAISGICSDSAKIYIKINPTPYATISLNDIGGKPDKVMYYNTTPNTVNAEWKLPDGTISPNKDSVLVQYDANGYYRVYLKVYNSIGCPDTTSILHRVLLKGMFLPNAFQPDSHNAEINTFKPAAIGIDDKHYHIGIWDLWGNLIWESTKVENTSPAEGWNGCDRKGNKLPSQDYIWRVKATFIDGTPWKGNKDRFGKYHFEGTLTLIR